MRSPRCAARGFIAAGPRSPTPGAPYAYVTTPGFLAHFGFESLRDLPDIEKLEDAGLLGRTSEASRGDALAAELRGVLGFAGGEARKTSQRKMRREARFYAKSPCAPWDCLLGCNLAKVGVEGSNPFVRSKISHRYQWFITIPGPFYASPSLELKRGKQGEAAKSET